MKVKQHFSSWRQPFKPVFWRQFIEGDVGRNSPPQEADFNEFCPMSVISSTIADFFSIHVSICPGFMSSSLR